MRCALWPGAAADGSPLCRALLDLPRAGHACSTGGLGSAQQSGSDMPTNLTVILKDDPGQLAKLVQRALSFLYN